MSETKIGSAIRMMRTSRKMTIGDLSAKSGSSTSHISMVENGLREPTVGFVSRVAQVFGIPCFVLVFMAEDQESMDADLRNVLSAFALRILTSRDGDA